MKTKTIKKNSGFTLVEVLFAVLILTFTVTGLMTIVANSLFSARYAKDEITANYLLQEVVDYIRNDRDTTVFLGSGSDLWNTFVEKYSNCSFDKGGCSFDVLKMLQSNSTALINSCGGGCKPLFYDDSNSEDNTKNTPFYVNDDGSGNIGKVKTNFIRKIVVTKSASNTNEMDVTVTVSWKNGSLDVSRSLSASFMNWRSQ